MAIDTADVIIFMCYVRTVLTANDRDIAVMLKKLKVSLCIEGLDDDSILDDVTEDDITLTFDDEELDEGEPEIETVISDEE